MKLDNLILGEDGNKLTIVDFGGSRFKSYDMDKHHEFGVTHSYLMSECYEFYRKDHNTNFNSKNQEKLKQCVIV